MLMKMHHRELLENWALLSDLVGRCWETSFAQSNHKDSPDRENRKELVRTRKAPVHKNAAEADGRLGKPIWSDMIMQWTQLTNIKC